MKNAASHAAMERARRVLPGGVSSPVRAFNAVGGEAPVITSAAGSHINDVDGNDYVDFVMAYGPHILGHSHPRVVEAVARQARVGTAFGATTTLEMDLAERIAAAVPSVEMVRFVNSGTEATMSAVRLARGATGRNGVIKCSGGYHGHADALLADAGSGVATLGIAGSPGIPPGAVADTHVVPYNDLAAVERVIASHGSTIACIIVEPVAGNMGCVAPLPGYLEGLRRLTAKHSVLLIFDEVMTGFRVANGGAQALYGITPDITCLGKVIGAGLPVGAYGGSRDLMGQMAPVGAIYQAGTLSGNPLAMAAGVAALDVIAEGGVYETLEARGARFENGLADASAGRITVNRVGSMLTPFFTSAPVHDYASARTSDSAAFARAHNDLREAGILWPPSQFEVGFISTAHTESEIDRAVDVLARASAGVFSA